MVRTGRRTTTRLLALGVGFTLLTVPFVAMLPTAVASSLNRIISDEELSDANSMSADRIQRFLVNHGSGLASYSIVEGETTKRAADVIAETAQQYRLSPKFFLTLLQKEQSLITDAHPSATQLDYALGFGCPSSCSPAYRGFGTQLRSAGKRIREDYLPGIAANGQFNGWGPGITKVTIDGIPVTPANEATAVLYIYNPYVGRYGGGDPRYGANSLFLQLWTSWFTKRHPDGSLLRVAGDPGVWLIRNGQRSPFKSRAAFLANYDPSKVVVVDRDEIESYDMGPPILYPEPSVLQLTTGGIYLIANGEKRPFASREAFRQIGFNPEEIIRGVKPEDVAAYPKGPVIESAEAFPSGQLLRSSSTGGVVFIDAAGTKHAIYSREIFRSQFRSQRPASVPDEALATYPAGDPVKFRDGELIGTKSEGKVYFVSNGLRRPIPSLEAFRQLGFKTKNVIWTNERSVTVHELGPSLSDVAAAQL